MTVMIVSKGDSEGVNQGNEGLGDLNWFEGRRGLTGVFEKKSFF